MKILLDGYRDHNLGDDLMLALSAEGLNEHEILQYGEKADLYLKVIGSGFLIHNNLGILYRLRDMRRERKHAPRRAVLNCCISPFINSAAEGVILRQLKSYDFITVRDSFSYEYIRNKIPRANVEVYPDMVFALPDSMIPDTPRENILGIAVHGSADYRKVARTADLYMRKTGYDTSLLCFDTGAENDVKAAEEIRSRSAYKEKIGITPYKSVYGILSEMKRCKVILGIRFHSNVLAARMRIPFVPVAYSSKTEHALRYAGYDGEIYTWDSFEPETAAISLTEAKPFDAAKASGQAQNHIFRLREFLKQHA